MQSFAKVDEREIIEYVLKNHGIDYIVTSSILKNLFRYLEIQKKK